jgi:hypothetical protein
MKRQPGFISTQGKCLLRQLCGLGSTDAFRAALSQPQFQEELAACPPSLVPMPHRFQKIAIPGVRVA